MRSRPFLIKGEKIMGKRNSGEGGFFHDVKFGFISSVILTPKEITSVKNSLQRQSARLCKKARILLKLSIKRRATRN